MKFKLTVEESNLMGIFYTPTSSRLHLIAKLSSLQRCGNNPDKDLYALINNTVAKLTQMSDEEFYQVEKEILLEESEVTK